MNKYSLIRRKKKTSPSITLRAAFRRVFVAATKREKLIFTTLTVASCVLITAFASMPLWLGGFIVTVGICAGLTLFSLWEDFEGIRYFTVPIPPILLTIAILLNFAVIPLPPLLVLPLVAGFAVGLYLTLLIANIFNISAIRVIPLIRAAHAANFFLVLLTVFLLVFFLATLHLGAFALLFGVFAIVAVPLFYLYWSLTLGNEVERSTIVNALVTCLIASEIAFVLALWPISPLLYALFITSILYVCAGIMNQEHANKLSRRVMGEYGIVLLFAFIMVMITAQWGG